MLSVESSSIKIVENFFVEFAFRADSIFIVASNFCPI